MAQAMCTRFKKSMFYAYGLRAGSGVTFKVALFTAAVTLDHTTTEYSATGEVTGSGYNAGGFALTNVNPTESGTTAMASFDATSPPLWTNVTIAPTQAMLYNAGTNESMAIFDFGGVQTVNAGTFKLTIPSVTPTTALLRLL